MAEFKFVCREFTRMIDSGFFDCSEKLSRMLTAGNIDGFEHAVLKWGREHPKVKYPTWGEWLMQRGVISGIAPGKAIDCNRNLLKPIDADVAEALKIPPVEKYDDED